MREYYLSLITGCFALLGVIVSNLFDVKNIKRTQMLNKERKNMTDTFINEYGEERDNLLWAASLIEEFNHEIESTKFHVYGLVGDWGLGK